MMERLLLGLWLMALLGGGFSARAQSTDEFEKEFQSFKQKVEAAKGGVEAEAPPPPPGPDPSPVLPAPSAVPAASPLAGGSPLGPAADLPLGKPAPATSQALDLLSPEEAEMRAEAEAAEAQKKLDEATFQEALKQLLPLKPEQIRKMLGSFQESRQASETPVATPVPRVAVETISLDPSETPPVIKTSPGRVTTLTVLDETGSPWPIQDVSWAGKFEVTPPEEGGHVVRITPQSAHGIGNISIRLVDLITPVTLTLQTGLDEVDYRFDARIPKRGPLAKTPLIEYGGLKTAVGGDANLVQILDGIPPGGSERLKVEGVDGRTNVWRVAGRIYLRTPLTLLSPAWNASVTSADGMNVYTLEKTPVILLSDEGRMVQAHITTDEGAP